MSMPDLAEAEQHGRTLAAMPAPISLPFAVLMAEYDRRGEQLEQQRIGGAHLLDLIEEFIRQRNEALARAEQYRGVLRVDEMWARVGLPATGQDTAVPPG